jgi:biotin carboxylase
MSKIIDNYRARKATKLKEEKRLQAIRESQKAKQQVIYDNCGHHFVLVDNVKVRVSTTEITTQATLFCENCGMFTHEGMR